MNKSCMDIWDKIKLDGELKANLEIKLNWLRDMMKECCDHTWQNHKSAVISGKCLACGKFL